MRQELKIEDFDYELPAELVAQRPLETRDASRLLAADRVSESLKDDVFSSVDSYLSPGDVLVLNDTRVFPARLTGRKATGGKVEVLLVGPSEEDEKVWRVLLQPALKEGQEIALDGGIAAVYKGRDLDGMALVELRTGDVRHYAREHGKMPLPPYVRREPDAADENGYQTVYSSREGAVAAPTAGLHFTRQLLDRIATKGVRVVTVTLHVGYGTFKPVKDIETHRMHSESFELKEEAAGAVNDARQAGRKVWAVGTTSVRVLETCALNGRVIAGSGETDIFILPPAKFEAVDGLITNFHLPRSTLLMLISAFMGHDFMRKAYRHAVEQRYRFYSYGDAMLIQ